MITAHKTNLGAFKQSYALTNGHEIKIVGFTIGSGGHNPLNNNPISVDRNVSVLPNQLYQSSNVSVCIVNSTTLKIECRLLNGECTDVSLSNIGLIAKIDDSDEEFLYAIANFSKIDREVGNLNFIIYLHS